MSEYVIKTASGSIASFSDGADNAPCKSVKCSIIASGGGGTPSAPVPIVGKSSVTVYQTGKNLTDLSTYVDGYVNTNGTFNTKHSNGEMRSGFIPVKPSTTYYFSIVETTGTAADWVGIGEYTSNETSSFIRRDSFWRFTTSANTHYIVISSRNLSQATKIQLEFGNDPTTYETYRSKTPIIVSWQDEAGTVYGGQYDFNTGVFTVTHELLTLDGSEDWQRSGTYNGSFYYDTGTHHIFSSGNSLCSHLVQAYTFPANYASGKFGLNGANSQFLNIWIMPANSTVYELVTYLQTQYNNGTPVQVALELTTPIVITGLDKISLSTYLGMNNFWCDSGDIEISYYSFVETANKYLIQSDTIIDITDKLREKLGTTTPIEVTNIPNEILRLDEALPAAEEASF